MKSEDKNQQEPFRPEQTPEPPQYMEPVERTPDASDQKNSTGNRKSDPKAEKKDDKPKETLLDEQADITDETTI